MLNSSLQVPSGIVNRVLKTEHLLTTRSDWGLCMVECREKFYPG